MKASRTAVIALLITALVTGGAVGWTVKGFQLAQQKEKEVYQDYEEERLEEIRLGLYYDELDMQHVGEGNLTVGMTKLSPDEGEQIEVTIDKWTGDDLVIAIPDTMIEKDWQHESYIIGKQGVIEKLYFDDLQPVDINLLPDRINVGINHKGIAEYSYEGKQLYGLDIERLTHQVEVLDNGNFAIVRCSFNQVMEITREGEIVWQWNALESIQEYNEETYVGWDRISQYEILTNILVSYRQLCENRWEWTHVNSVQKLEDGYLINLRNLDLVVRVNKEGETVWSFGNLVIKHAHCARILENGNLLVYDNGNGRVIELKPDSEEIVWEFTGLIAPVFGWVQKLWNGNYLITDCYRGKVYEVSPNKEIVKEITLEGTWIATAKAYRPGEIPNTYFEGESIEEN